MANSELVEALANGRLEVWKLWLMEGSRSVEALATRRL